MKNLILSSFLLLAFANFSTVKAQCVFDDCPSDQVIEACSETDFAIVNQTGFAYDDGGVPNIPESDFNSMTDGSVSGCTPLFNYIDQNYSYNPGSNPFITWERVWETQDGATCTQLISIEDTSPPTINCPTPAVLEIDLANSDPCDGSSPLIQNETGFPFSSGLNVLSDPNDFQAMTSGSALDPPCSLYEVSYEDVDNGVSCGTGDPNVAFSFERTWTVTDQAGNQDMCTQTINLMDFDGPQLQGGVAFFTNQDPDGFNIVSAMCPITVTWVEPEAGDFVTNCGSSVVNLTSSGGAPGDLFDAGTTQICYDYEDECGNTEQTCFDITINCPNCVNGAPQYTSCDEPPVACNANDLNASSCTPIPDGNTTPLCGGGAIHNGSYFTFVAGAETLELTITPSNCLSGQGIQATVTDPCDANTCYTSNGADCFSTSTTITATGLTIGNIYNVVVDGCNADVCDWSLSINAAPFTFDDPTSPVVSSETCSLGPNESTFCTGQAVTFFPENLEDGSFFFCWDISSQAGITALNLDSNCPLPDPSFSFSCSSDYSTCGPLELEFSQPGTYQLCLTEMSNGCDDWQGSFCWDFTIEDTAPIDFGQYKVCANDLALGWDPGGITVMGENWEGGVISAPGVVDFTVTDDCDCSYTQMIEVIEIPSGGEDFVDVYWCANDIDNWEDIGLGLDWNSIQSFYDPATNVASLIDYDGGSLQTDYDGMNCDTTIFFTFNLYEINGVINVLPGAGCDMVLEFEIGNLPGFMNPDDISYQWVSPGGMNLGTASTESVSMDGVYNLEVSYLIPETGAVCMYEFNVPVIIGATGTPAAPVITAPSIICADNTNNLPFSVPVSSGTNYTWTITNGTPATAGGTDVNISITDPTMPLQISVIASSPCGDSPAAIETYTVSPQSMVTVLPDTTVCVGETIILTSSLAGGQIYNWTVSDTMATWNQATASAMQNLSVTWGEAGMHNYTVQVQDANGCLSNVFTGLVTAVDQLPAPTNVMCSSTSNSVTITWTDAMGGMGTDLTSTVPGMMMGTNSYTVTGLAQGASVDFVLTTLSTDHPCGNGLSVPVTCMTGDCNLNPMIEQVPDVCLDGTTTTISLVDINNTMNPVWSVTGATPAGALTGNDFDPAIAGAGVHVIELFVEDLVAACDATTSVTINVFDQPDEDFALSIPDTICLEEFVEVTFDNNPTFNYAWDLGQDNTSPSTAASGFMLGWTTPGDKEVTMTVTNGAACTPLVVTKDIYVRPALQVAGVFCGTLTTTSVEGTWAPIPGVTEYEVTVIIDGGTPMTFTQTGTTYEETGLMEGQVVTITVVPISPHGCDTFASPPGMCEAQSCTDFDVQITSPANVLCLEAGLSVNLTAEVFDDAGMPANGTGEWVGQDIDPVTGEFTPTLAQDYTLTYSFSEDGTSCPGTNDVTISIVDSPSAAFTVESNDVCVGEELIVTLDGPFDPGVITNWTVSNNVNNFTETSNGNGEFTFIFEDGSGTVDITLETSIMTIAGTCDSDPETVSIELLAPLEFELRDTTVCYLIDEDIQMEAFDPTSGASVDGSWSGDDISMNGNFVPLVTDTTYVLTFEEANCGETAEVMVTLVEKPAIDIDNLDITMCVGDTADITITTDFSTELAHVGDEPDLIGLSPNYQITFDQAGTYEYMTFIDRAGDCDSDVIMWTVTVEDEVEYPVVTCVQTLNSVTFSWNTVPCADEYTILINDQAQGTITDTEYEVTGLMEGESVDFSMSISSLCACEFENPVTETCAAMDCEPATITFVPELDSEYCLSDLPASFQLTDPDVMGDEIDNSGDFTWFGDGVSPDGTFDISGLGAGSYNIGVTYEEDGCFYDNDIDFAILGVPDVIFDITDAPCDGAVGNINIFVEGAGPYTIEAGGQSFNVGDNESSEGSYNMMVTDNNGCVYEETINVGVLAAADSDFIAPTFIWTDSTSVLSIETTNVTLDSIVWTVDGEVVSECEGGTCDTYDFTPMIEGISEVCVFATYGDGCTILECRSIESEILRIKSTYIPNIITPDDPNPQNTALNLYIEGCDLVIQDISIYDRWGNRVYNNPTDISAGSNDVVELWDGRFGDFKEYISGVYVYSIEVMDEDGNIEYMIGDVTIFN